MCATDLELLARYTRQRAEDAFAELVRRHLGLVYSAALRQVRSAHLAEEVAQYAFIVLLRVSISKPRRARKPGGPMHDLSQAAEDYAVSTLFGTSVFELSTVPAMIAGANKSQLIEASLVEGFALQSRDGTQRGTGRTAFALQRPIHLGVGVSKGSCGNRRVPSTFLQFLHEERDRLLGPSRFAG